ncbi:imidazolonepropionase [Marinoscillum luteum]|uniref:Imidazolonepropionase n=1 Tax=Marinoscillum luteum TaxID=861051 RepID=A0ABW7NAX1_9BACT
MPILHGPFRQIIALWDIPLKGKIQNEQLTVIEQGGVVVEDGYIVNIAPFSSFDVRDYEYHPIEEDMVLIPGLVDCHTHLVWGGSRYQDYTMRTSGRSYQDILAAGGGIFDSVRKTQQAESEDLLQNLIRRADKHLNEGVTTIEVKTGYGLETAHELRLLEVIRDAKSVVKADLVPTCLAAHVCPRGYEPAAFLAYLENELLPQVLVRGLSKRVDIFVEDNAFPEPLARPYLSAARKLGFELTVHADQFSVGGSKLAVEMGAFSADHLEASGENEIKALATSDVISVALPGASLGLGMQFTPARKLLDAGASLAIATDWNPGSAPMGDLLVQTSLLGVYEKLTAAELLAGITFRAAQALNLRDRGRLAIGERADMIAFSLKDYREIFYHQGSVKPSLVWKSGQLT